VYWEKGSRVSKAKAAQKMIVRISGGSRDIEAAKLRARLRSKTLFSSEMSSESMTTWGSVGGSMKRMRVGKEKEKDATRRRVFRSHGRDPVLASRATDRLLDCNNGRKPYIMPAKTEGRLWYGSVRRGSGSTNCRSTLILYYVHVRAASMCGFVWAPKGSA
jgi:hypothetical protein